MSVVVRPPLAVATVLDLVDPADMGVLRLRRWTPGRNRKQKCHGDSLQRLHGTRSSFTSSKATRRQILGRLLRSQRENPLVYFSPVGCNSSAKMASTKSVQRTRCR